MTTPPENKTPLRRPTPERTEPNRGILGVFGQSTWAGAPDTGHPLGPGFAPETEPVFMDDNLREASSLIDDHIRQGTRDSAIAEDGFLSSIAALSGATQTVDLSELASQATRAYSDIASLWVDLAAALREQIGARRMPETPPPQGAPKGGTGPTLSIITAKPVEARVEMFRPAQTLTAQPLGSDDPAQTRRITEVVIEQGRLRITVPADQPPGTYYGLLLEPDVGPAGVITLEVFGAESAAL